MTDVLDAGAEVARDLGTGSAVVLLHGVGVGPSSFDAVADVLAATRRVVVLRRPVGGTVDARAAAIAATLSALDTGPIVLAGVSGGATLALAAAIVAPSAVAAVVAHEPLLGTHAPTLHERVRDGAEALAAGAVSPAAWFRRLVGPHTSAALGDDAVTEPVDADDVAGFAAWEPTVAQLDALRQVRVVTTVGTVSDAARREAAAALAVLAGAEVVALPGVGHLPQLEDPAAFAAVVAST